MVGTKGRVGLFTVSALVMTGSTVMLKALYNTVNGTGEEDGTSPKPERNTPMDESSLPEAASGMARQAHYVSNAMKD